MYYASHDITVAYTFNYICVWKAVKWGLDIILVYVNFEAVRKIICNIASWMMIPILFFILTRIMYFQPKWKVPGITIQLATLQSVSLTSSQLLWEIKRGKVQINVLYFKWKFLTFDHCCSINRYIVRLRKSSKVSIWIYAFM